MKDFFIKIKQKVAAVLVVVLSMQTVLGAGPFGLTVAHAGTKNRVDLMTAEPDQAAFEELYVETGTAVSGEGDKLSMRFHFKLSDAWVEEKLYEYVDGGLDDPGDYGTSQEYDAYLESLDDGALVPLSFTCTVADGALDVPEIREYLEANPDIYTTKNEKIGTWSVDNGWNGPVFHIILDKKVYNRTGVTANRGLEAQLLERFQPGDTVDSGRGTGDVDLVIKINGSGEPIATNSDYVMEKSAESGADTQNAEGEADPSAINFTVSVRASASNAETGRTATASGWAALASPSESGYTAASASGWDDDDEIAVDEQDGELVFDWWNFTVPVKPDHAARVDWKSAEEAGIDLSGKYVVDSISKDLNLDAVEVSYDGGGWERLDIVEITGVNSWEEYLDANNRLFSYEIQGQDDGAVVEFDIRFYTRISDALWVEYGQAGRLDREFPNKAILKAEDESATLAISNQVKPSIRWESLVEKEGVPLDVNGDVYQWKIHVDAHFSDGVNLYLIDHIKDTEHTHEYILDGDTPVRIETEGGAGKSFEVEILEEDELGEFAGKSFEELTITDLEELLGHSRFNDGKVYVYKYSHGEGTGAQTDQIMLIPLKGYTNGSSAITYETDIRAAKTRDNLEYEATLSNEVKPVWKWYGGLGPGPEPFGSVTVGKEYKIRVRPVDKKGVGYNPATNTVTWEFEVNQRGVNLDRVLIMDNLDDAGGKGMLEWSGLVSEHQNLLLTRTDRRPVQGRVSPEDRQIEYVEPDEWNIRVNRDNAAEDVPGDYYTVLGKELNVRLDGMTAAEYYKFTVETQVKDGNYAQDGEWEVINKASAIVTAGGQNTDPMEIQAPVTIKHSLLSKYVEPFIDDDTKTEYLYNYQDNTVQWKVLVNSDGREIRNAVVTDRLPLGTTFANMVSAMKGTEGNKQPGIISGDGRMVEFGDGTAVSLTVQEGTGAYPDTKKGSYSKDTVTFTFPETVNEPYEFVFTTTVDENFRKEIVKSADADGEPLLNHVELNGTIDGVAITGATAEATNAIAPKPLLKEGQYHGLEKYTYYDDDDPTGREIEAVWFGWTAYVNRTGADMEGVRIWDTLEECFELIPGSVKVDAVLLDARGRVTGEPQPIMANGKTVAGAEPLTGWVADGSGFRFEIPEAYKDRTLRLTFDTVLADDAAASQMVNTIHAEGNGWNDSSGEVTDDNALDFTLSDYATAEGMLYLRVLKSSSNKNAGKLYLKDAEFSLQKMTQKAGGDPATIEGWERTGSAKVRKTRGNGALSYLFLQPDTMYCLEETIAPAGYKKEEKSWYIVARLTEKTDKDFPDEAVSGDYEIIVNQEKDQNSLSYEVHNSPNVAGGVNELRFVKTGQNGQILTGVRFQLKSSHQSWTKETDENGVVSFENLDPLPEGEYYILRETQPVGYKRLPAYYVSVTVDEAGVYSLVLLDENKKEVTNRREDPGSTDPFKTGIYEVKNTPIQNSGSFLKVNQNQEPVKDENVIFKIYRCGDGGSKEADGSHTVVMNPGRTGYVPYLPQPTVESEAGVVKLDSLYYGYYRLDEQDPVKGSNILAPEKPVSVYIKVDGSGIKALPAGTANPETAADRQYTLKLDGGTGSGSLTVSNTMKWGLLQIHKVLGSYDGTSWEPEIKDGKTIPLQDILFGVYHTTSEGNLGDLYMRLKTGPDGMFRMDEHDPGRYQVFDAQGNPENPAVTKALLSGEYYLKELSAPEKYITDGRAFPFTIVTGTGDGIGDYQAAPAVSIHSEADDLQDAAVTGRVAYFLNKPVRQPVELVKEDGYDSSVKLNHAQFHVLIKDGNREYVVAELNSTRADGTYRLAPLQDTGCGVCAEAGKIQNENGERYLEENPDRTSEGARYLLLPGTYKVRETTAPYIAANDGLYPLDETMFATLQVSTSGVSLAAAGGSLNPQGLTVKNNVKYGSVKLTKAVMMLTEQGRQNGSYIYDRGAGFRFTLSGYPAQCTDHSPENRKTWSGITEKDGTIVFREIPVGSYILTETDVPAEYKDSEGKWLVKAMPDIWVEITPVKADAAKDATVTACYAVNEDGSRGAELTTPNGEIPQDKSGIYLQNGTDASSVTAYNALKLASINGTKLAVTGSGDGGREAALSGAEFTLTHKTLKMDGSKPYTFKATTDRDGKLSLGNIPYGAYTLEETGVPDGFEKMPVLDITVTDTTAPNGVYSLNDNRGDSLLRDNVVLVGARFQKLDQSGNGIPNEKLDARFTVDKIENGVGGSDFWPQGGMTVSTDDKGYLTLENLSYGIYEVTETLTAEEREKLDSEAGLAKFWLVVKSSEEAGKTEVSVYGEKPSAGGLRGLVDSVLRKNQPIAAGTVSSKGTADFTDAGNYPEMAEQMTNILRHGRIQINKVGGDAVGESGHERIAPLGGVQFGICRAGETDPYLTLETDKSGRFPEIEQGGIYTDAVNGEKKVLYAGSYILKETSTVKGYKICGLTAEFTVSDRGEVIFIGYDGRDISVATGSDSSANGVKFYNIPERGRLEFIKKDSDTGKKLDGAVFLAYTDEAQRVPVAFISQRVDGGRYEIIGDARQVEALKEQYRSEMKGWKDTIDGVAAVSGNEDDGYALKAGTYYLREIKAPADYKIPEDTDNKIPVTIVADQTVSVQSGTVQGNTEKGTVANTIVKADLEFIKTIETSSYRPGDTAAGMRFVLKGTSSNAVPEASWRMESVSQADGKFSFVDVPVGTYRLYECDEAADTHTDQYLGFTPGAADEMEVLLVSVTADDGRAKVDYTKAGDSPVEVGRAEGRITLTNRLKLGDILGRKVAAAAGTVGLKDAYIGIFRTRSDALSGTNPVTVVRSSDDGEFLFENVPYGTYYVREQQAPYGYAPGTAVFKVTVREARAEAVTKGINVETDENAGEVTDILFANGNRRGELILRKKASPSDLVLSDAVFTVYARYTDGVLDVPVAYLEYQSDGQAGGVYKLADGQGLTGQLASRIPYLQRGENGDYYLIQGHYWVAETTVPNGYRRETDGERQKVYPVTISGSGTEQQLPAVEITNDDSDSVFYNDLMTGGFTLRKTIEIARPGDREPDSPQAGGGFRFRIAGTTSEAAGEGTPVSRINTIRIDGKSLKDAPNGEPDGDTLLVTTGADGRVEISGMPIGDYTVTEVDGSGMELYTGTEPKAVTVRQNSGQTALEIAFDGKTADMEAAILSFHNSLKRYCVEGEKVDEKGAALSGARFGLYSEDRQTRYREAVTDDKGRFVFDRLPTGKYAVREIASSGEDYVVEDTAYPVMITGDMDPSKPIQVMSEPIVNVLKRGFVEIEKTDPEDPDYRFTEVRFTLYARDGRKIADLKQKDGGNRFTLASPSNGLYEKDDKGDCYLVWDDSGQRTALIYGDYYIQETNPEPGYLADLDGGGKPIKHEFSITEDGKTVVLSNNGAGEFENRRAKGRLILSKEKEVIGANVFTEVLDKAPGEGFTFRISYQDTTEGNLFRDADIRKFAVVDQAVSVETGKDGDQWLEVTTGTDGSVRISNLLTGEYTITEVRKGNRTDAYVLPSDQTFTVEVDWQDNTVTEGEVTFVNRLKRSRVEGLKTGVSGRPLAGAVIGLFPSDTVEFTEQNLFYGKTAVSGEDGTFRFEQIPYGTYRIAELKAPFGYHLNTRTSYLVTVVEDGAVVAEGIPEDKGNAAGTERTAIVIANTKKSSGGGGGGGNRPGPVDPADPTNPGLGVETEESTETTAPVETVSPTDPSVPGDPTVPTIPFDPENPVIDIPGNPPRVEIVDDDDNTVYEGPGSKIDIGGWEPGNYTVYTFDDQDVPLGTMTFTINDEGVPLAFMLPKTGDTTLPYALLAAIMLGALAGMIGLAGWRRKRKW